jgi:LemA protein
MKRLTVATVLLLLLAVVVGATYITRRNQMVVMNQAVTAQWQQVDVVLERRADLIPNLVETVKGYAPQEQTVFGDVDNARTELLRVQEPLERIAANQQLDGALGRLLAVSENYPKLESNENFLRLQDELAGNENRIAVERRRYNDLIREYNAYIQLFPNNIFARWAGFQPNNTYFTIPDVSRQVPAVRFAVPATAPAK